MKQPKKQPFFSSVEQEAQDTLIKAINAALEENDIYMGGMVNCVEQCCGCGQTQCDKDVDKLKKKLIKLIIKAQVDIANYIDYLFTKITKVVYSFLESQYWLLNQLCVKSGLMGIGGDICSLLAVEACDLQCQPATPTINLDFSMVIPYFKGLLEVLKEIRNRMPPEAVQLVGEELAQDYIELTEPMLPAIPLGTPDLPIINDSQMGMEL